MTWPWFSCISKMQNNTIATVLSNCPFPLLEICVRPSCIQGQFVCKWVLVSFVSCKMIMLVTNIIVDSGKSNGLLIPSEYDCSSVVNYNVLLKVKIICSLKKIKFISLLWECSIELWNTRKSTSTFWQMLFLYLPFWRLIFNLRSKHVITFSIS